MAPLYQTPPTESGIALFGHHRHRFQFQDEPGIGGQADHLDRRAGGAVSPKARAMARFTPSWLPAWSTI